jgi:hypothetical protein
MLAGFRLCTGTISVLALTGAATITGAGGQPLDPAAGLGSTGEAVAFAGSTWNLVMAMSLVVAAAVATWRGGGATVVVAAWSALTLGEVSLRTAALLGWRVLPELARVGLFGGQTCDDLCCGLPSSGAFAVAALAWFWRASRLEGRAQ